MKIGDTLRYALAEVCGYGAQAGKMIQGGQTAVDWWPNPSMDRKVVLNGVTMTEHYLTDYGYPDYVNSRRVNKVPVVANVQQVAHKAFTAYLGTEPTLPTWPENNPNRGVYTIPMPCPAPGIKISNTPDAVINISWTRAVEGFHHARLMGTLVKYNVYRATSPMGPWTKIAAIDTGKVMPDSTYLYVDTTSTFRIGEYRYYAVTSEDDKGNESGKTNAIQFTKIVAAVKKMGKVYAVPNPFNMKSGYAGTGEEKKIGFYGLPIKCTIRVFTYSGQLVKTIEHNADSFSNLISWYQISRNNQELASGIYLYVVTTPEGQSTNGKFVIIK